MHPSNNPEGRIPSTSDLLYNSKSTLEETMKVIRPCVDALLLERPPARFRSLQSWRREHADHEWPTCSLRAGHAWCTRTSYTLLLTNSPLYRSQSSSRP